MIDNETSEALRNSEFTKRGIALEIRFGPDEFPRSDYLSPLGLGECKLEGVECAETALPTRFYRLLELVSKFE